MNYIKQIVYSIISFHKSFYCNVLGFKVGSEVLLGLLLKVIVSVWDIVKVLVTIRITFMARAKVTVRIRVWLSACAKSTVRVHLQGCLGLRLV